MRLDVDENYVDLVEIGENALYPLVLEALRGVSARERRRSTTFNAHQENRRQVTPRGLSGMMARVKTLAEYLLKLTEFLDQEVSKGFDLNDKGHHEVPPRATCASLDSHSPEGDLHQHAPLAALARR